jgi:CheY-like chemotaxis protein/HPt (histidine-containing phosphotransfer) domain-containing protein
MDTSPRHPPGGAPDRLAALLFDAALTDEEVAFAKSVEASFEAPLASSPGAAGNGFRHRTVAAPPSPSMVPSDFDDAADALMTTIGAAGREEILVVDGTPVSQAIAVRMLANCGFRAEVAPDRATALALLNGRSFVAVLIECDMTAPDGFDTVSEIRRRCGGERRIPVIATTAGMTTAERSRLLAAGIDDFLPKPLRNQTLQDTLARWVDAMPAPAEPEGHRPALLQETIVAELETLDGEVLDSLLDLYFAETAELLPGLRQAMDQGETVTLGQGAHKLRGSSCALGAAHVSSLYAGLEAAAGAGDLIEAGQLLDQLPQAITATRRAFSGRSPSARRARQRRESPPARPVSSR